MKYYHTFNSIAELIGYIENTPCHEGFNKNEGKPSSIAGDKHFTGTDSFEEAKDLLMYGWSYMAEELEKRLKTSIGVAKSVKNVYSVQGYQACVPRYLQGMPDNMIYKKQVEKKQAVVKLYKSISYSAFVSSETIIKESVKVLRLVKDLENKGIKCELNIILGTRGRDTDSITYVKIKNASQRLNIKQVAFPLVNPSMLRRISFATVERYDECNNSAYFYGYGIPINKTEELFDMKDIKNKNVYYFPAIIDEEEITNIEAYRVGNK